MENLTSQANETSAAQIVSEKIAEKITAEATETEPKETTQVAETKTESTDDYSRRFAELAKRDAHLSDREKKIKQYEEKLKQYERLEKLKQEDPASFLEETGMNFEQLARAVIEKTAGKKDLTADEKIALLEKKLQERDEKEQLELEQRAITKFKTDLNTFVSENKETYELINSLGEQDLVYEVIEEYFERNKKVLDHKTAADLVEEQLMDRLKSLKDAKKVKNLFASALETAQNNVSSPEQAKSGKEVVTPITTKTLTAKAVPVTTEAPRPEGRLLSREESLKRAAEFLKQKLSENKGVARA